MPQRRSCYRKIIITVICSVLLLGLYVMIFSFSAQDGDTSSGISGRISEIWVEVLSSVTGRDWSDAVKKEMAIYFEHPIRKMAHFTEYAAMGILLFGIWSGWIRRRRGLYLLVILWVAVSASFDEIHQIFVPGRSSSPLDVLLDTFGGTFGMLCGVLSEKIIRRIHRSFS